MREKNPPFLLPTWPPILRPAKKMMLSPTMIPMKPVIIISVRFAFPACTRYPPRISETSSGSGTPSPQANRIPNTTRYEKIPEVPSTS